MSWRMTNARRVLALPVLALLFAGCGGARQTVEVGGGAKASRAPAAIDRYGCGSCHTIPDVSGANAEIGPNLGHFADRRYIAGRLANTPANLITWIRDPQGVDPGNVMPELGVTARDARDIAAYLDSH
jgi:cytochrome c